MKKYFFYILLPFAFAACKKGNYTPNGSPNPKYNVPIQTNVTGIKDISMKQSDAVEMPIKIDYVSGTKEPVSITITNLPDSVFVSIIPQLDTPNYSSVVRFVSMKADTGTTTVTLSTAASKAASTKQYNFQLTILPNPVNHALSLVGNYNAGGACVITGAINNTVSISAVPGYINRIKVEKIWTGTSNGYYFYADLNPTNKTISIPSQTNNGFLYSGNGTYNDSELNITYTLSDGNLVYDNCTSVLTKK